MSAAIRFYPLADHPRFGVLKAAGSKPAVARYLTPDEAKAQAAQPFQGEK